MLPDRKETKLGSSDQEASPSTGKNTGVVLVSFGSVSVCSYWKCVPTAIFGGGPWVSFVMTDEFSVMVTKIASRIGVSWTHSLSFFFLTNLNLMNYGHIIKSM